MLRLSFRKKCVKHFAHTLSSSIAECLRGVLIGVACDSNVLNCLSENRKVDIGCGGNKLKGFVGVDHLALPSVDIVHNLEEIPWPIETNSCSWIVFRHAISHLSDIVAVMRETHRIARQEAVVEIVAPHYASDNFNTDPTHRINLGFRSMNYFCANIDWPYRYLGEKPMFDLEHREISFREVSTCFQRDRHCNPARALGLESLVNTFPRIYERFLAFTLPPSEVYFRLIVNKDE